MDFGFDGPDPSPMGHDANPTASTAVNTNKADTLKHIRLNLASELN
jgi:hypothetical protein